MANDDLILTTMRFIRQHEVVQIYGAILPDYLINPAMKESEAYKTYHDLATGKVQPKPKYVRRSSKTKADEAPKPSSSKRVKAMAKLARSGKKKQPTPGLEALSDIALTEAEQMKLAIERSKTQLYISQPSGFGAHEGTEGDNDEANVGNDKDDDDHDDDHDEQSESDNDDDDDNDDEVQGVNIEGEEMDEEENNEEDEGNEYNWDSECQSRKCSRLKTLEIDFSEFKQMNQFAEAISFILGIADAYLANKMNEAVKTAVQLKSDRLRDEAQAENEDFLNKLDDNIKKIIKDQVKEHVKSQVSKILPRIEKTINEQLEAKVMTCSSTESKTSLAITANLSELELKKILIEKMDSNKSIHRSNEQKNLYKALVEAYKSDKLILDTYGDTRRRAGKEQELTSVPKEKTSKTTSKSTDGSKSQHKSAGESAHTEDPMHTDKDLEEPAHPEFDIGATEEQSDEETSQHPDWFQKPAKHPTPDHDWNKTLLAVHGPVQPWLSTLAREKGPCESFDKLMDTPLDFSVLMMNRLKIDTLTPKLLVGPTFMQMKRTCKSLVELEYFFKDGMGGSPTRHHDLIDLAQAQKSTILMIY
ncbi:hypothetical protein Tco_0196186 [Tanacetum coccineum]